MDIIQNDYNQPQKRQAATDVFWVIAIALLVFVIVIFIFQYSWNGSMPHIFGLRQINWIQALLVLIVARFIFAGGAGTGIVI